MTESGLILKWAKDAIHKQKNKKTPEFINDVDVEDQNKDGHKPLSIKNLHGAFVLLIIGYLVALISFLSEIAITKFLQR